MAFKKKTWKDRLVEYAGRRTLKRISGSADSQMVVDVTRNEGTVSQAGDAFSAANMNDLEQRIADGFTEVTNNLKGFTPILDSAGRITGYKTQAGADTVFPFNSVITGEATFNSNEMPLFTVSNIPSEPKMVFWYTKNYLNRNGVFINFKNISSILVGLFFRLEGSAVFYNNTTYMRYDSALKTVTLASPSGYSVNQKVGYAIVL